MHFVDGCFVTALDNLVNANDIPDGGLKIYEEFTCPMWFKNTISGMIVKTLGRVGCEVISQGNTTHKVSEILEGWKITNMDRWVQVNEPKSKIVTIEKWLLSNKTDTEQWVWSGSPSYFEKMPNGFRKLKLLDSYEVTL